MLLKSTSRQLSDRRLKSFTIALTNNDPRTDGGPLKAAYSACASRTQPMAKGETISLTCTDQLNTRGRYLVIVANNTHNLFQLAEVEVFTGRLLNMDSCNTASVTANTLILLQYHNCKTSAI